jgi:hypothetical protein
MPTRISCLRTCDALAGGLNSSSGPWRSLILLKNNFDNKKLYIFYFNFQILSVLVIKKIPGYSFP